MKLIVDSGFPTGPSELLGYPSMRVDHYFIVGESKSLWWGEEAGSLCWREEAGWGELQNFNGRYLSAITLSYPPFWRFWNGISFPFIDDSGAEFDWVCKSNLVPRATFKKQHWHRMISRETFSWYDSSIFHNGWHKW